MDLSGTASGLGDIRDAVTKLGPGHRRVYL